MKFGSVIKISILLGGAKKILGCSSRTCNEAVRGDMELETLKSHRDKAKLKWWYKLASMPVRRYPRQLLIRNGRLNHVEEDRGSLGIST